MDWPARPEGQTPDITGCPDEPWWTRDAITWLDAHLTPDMTVLEWGAGASTIWLARRVREVISIEHDFDWARRVVQALPIELSDRLTMLNTSLGPEYYGSPVAADIAIVDGRLRVFCCENAIRLLPSGGLLVLDDAERPEYAEVHELLADWPVIRTIGGERHTDIWTKP